MKTQTNCVNQILGPVGFIGLGQMGGGIVRNLLSKNLSIVAFDSDEEVVNKLKGSRIEVAKNPSEVAKKVSILFLCLPFTPQIEEVLFGEFGVINSFCPNLLIVDMSTIYFDDAQNISLRLQKSDISYCDAPISGLPLRARKGTLTIMFGGSRKAYSQALPYLDLIGEFIVYCGECGSGQLMKGFNNVVYNINIAAVSEILSLALKSGLSSAALEKVFISGSSRSFASEYFVPKMLRKEFTGDYPMDAALKDIVNVQKAISDVTQDKPILEAMIGIYNEALKKGLGQKSKSAMFEVYKEKYHGQSKNQK